MTKRDEAEAARVARLRQYGNDKLSDKEIALREGYDASNVNKTLSRLGIDRGSKADRKEFTDGLFLEDTIEGRTFRRRLWEDLEDLLKIYDPIEVASMTGVSQNNQSKARDKVYDWRMSDINRLANIKGMNVLEYLRDLTNRPIHRYDMQGKLING